MALSKAEKTAYNNYIKQYKGEIEEINKEIRALKLKSSKMKNLKAYYNFEEANAELKKIYLFNKMSDASLEMLKIKNETFLNDSRKGLYRVLQIMEEVVGNDIDRALTENDDYLVYIDRFTPAQILIFVEKLYDMYEKIVTRLGDNSKWRWSFVELYGRIVVINQNIISFTEMQKNRDPRSEYYKERMTLLMLCKNGLSEGAKNYRQKYEISTHVSEDLLRSIEFLSALKKVHVTFGDTAEAEKLKIRIDATRERLNSDESKKDKKK